MFSTFAALSLVIHLTIAKQPAGPTVQPAGFPGEDAPYQDIPTGTDVSAQNRVGTFLYSYNDCKKIFGAGAKGKIDDAYYDAWVMSNTAGVASGIDWNSAAALEFLGAPGLNKDKQSQIQAVLANAATVIYSYKDPFQHYLRVRCDDRWKRCQNRPDPDPCHP